MLVVASVAMALVLFEISTRIIGLLGLVPLTLGLRGLWGLRHAAGRSRLADRAFGSGLIAAAVVTIGAGGDNLAVYIPLFRVDRVGGTLWTLLVFALAELLLTLVVRRAGGHPRVRSFMTRLGIFATPILYCVIGVLVLLEAGTL